jgi:uncharacterized membrane protein
VEATPGRIVGVDVARCLALVGMIATHALPPLDEHGVTAVQQLAGGRSSALFAVLAGVSIALVSGRTTPARGPDRRRVAAALAVRATVIALLGLLLGALETTIAVILTYYGVLFLLGLPFLGLRARSLALLSAGWLLVVPVLSQLLRPHLPPPGTASPSPESLAHPWQLLTELTFTGYYPAATWTAYLLAGMALGRLDLGRTRTGVRLAALGGVVAVGSWTVSRLLLGRPDVWRALESGYDGGNLRLDLDHGLHGTTPTYTWWWLAVDAPHSGTPVDLAHTIGSALLVIGLALLVARLAPRTIAVLFGAGAMTLTLYSLHVVLRTPAFWPDDDVPTFLLHVAIVLVVGAAYRLARRRGPLESMVAALADPVRGGARSGPAASARGGVPPRP